MVSVLIVNLNNLEFTKNCVNDLLSQDCDFSLTIVDQNSSEEGTSEYFSLLPSSIEFIQNKSNVSLNHIWNWFVEKSKTPYICLLNNDVRIAPNFLSSAIQVFEKEQNVGFVNHVSNNKDYQVWSNQLDYKIIETPYRQGWDPIFRKECYNQIPNELSFFYGDDYIYSKLYSSGMKGAYVLNSPMIHFERSTTVEKGGQRDASPDSSYFHQLDLEFKNMSFIEELSKWKPEFSSLSCEIKEIFLILYHKSSDKSIEHLNKLIIELESRDKKFIIASHSEIPIEILKKSKSYIYDSENYIVDSSSNNMIYWISIGDKNLYSPYLYYGSLSDKNYGLAAFKNMLNGASISHQLGYDIVHSIEYDFIPNFDDIQSNYNLISSGKYDSVIYTDNETDMLGNVFSFKTSNYSDTKWNEKYWTDIFKNNNYFTENMLFQVLSKWYGKNKVYKKSKSIQGHGEFTSVSGIQTVLFENDDDINILVFNNSNEIYNNICIYSTYKYEIDIIYPNCWNIFNLGEKEKFNFAHIFNNNTLLKKWNITSEIEYQKYIKVNNFE
jgi:hypothetical protein